MIDKVVAVITVRKRSCGKVMFLHLSVSHSVGGGSLPQCMLEYTPGRWLLLRTVCILLECILVVNWLF